MKSTHLIFILLLSVFIAEKTHAIYINNESEQFDLNDLDNLDEDTDYYDDFDIEPEDIQEVNKRVEKKVDEKFRKKSCLSICVHQTSILENCFENCMDPTVKKIYKNNNPVWIEESENANPRKANQAKVQPKKVEPLKPAKAAVPVTSFGSFFDRMNINSDCDRQCPCTTKFCWGDSKQRKCIDDCLKKSGIGNQDDDDYTDYGF